MTKQRNMHLADNMPSMPQEFKRNIEKAEQTAKKSKDMLRFYPPLFKVNT
ncbi:MAG: hypothetical protein RR767_07055 [Acinetobacter sp.]